MSPAVVQFRETVQALREMIARARFGDLEREPVRLDPDHGDGLAGTGRRRHAPRAARSIRPATSVACDTSER